MIYILLLLLLFPLMYGYFYLARRFNIVDRPNARSSHQKPTIRGGGIIFPIAMLVWFAVFGWQYPYFMAGLIVISFVSFIDDRYSLPARVRWPFQLLAVVLLLWQTGIFGEYWLWVMLGLVLITGWINAFNFMDGINGITALYALVALISFFWINLSFGFISEDFILLAGLSVLVFTFFNARRRALTFAGDVGSVSMAFILAFLMLRLILISGQWHLILFFSVYGVDTVITIMQRLRRGENIFQAHRSHLYQYLANEKGWSHLNVAIIYAAIQLAINSMLILMGSLDENARILWFIILLLLQVAAYIFVKLRIQRNIIATP